MQRGRGDSVSSQKVYDAIKEAFNEKGIHSKTIVFDNGSEFLAREPVKNMERSGIFFTINHPLCGCETKAYSKKLSSKAIQ